MTSRIHQTLLFALGLAVVLTVGAPRDAEAQGWECGTFCDPCSISGQFAGSPEHPYSHRNYWSLCSWGGCNPCPVSIEDQVEDVEQIRQGLESASPETIGELVARFADRLLIHSPRNMVVILGGCDGDAPQALVFLSDRVSEALGGLDLTTLADYLSEVEQGTAEATAIDR